MRAVDPSIILREGSNEGPFVAFGDVVCCERCIVWRAHQTRHGILTTRLRLFGLPESVPSGALVLIYLMRCGVVSKTSPC